MKKFLVYFMCISTEKIGKKYIEDESMYGENVMDFVDSIIDSDTIYRIFGGNITEEEADRRFAEYRARLDV